MTSASAIVTFDRLLAVLVYDSETGVFTWLPRDLSQFESRTHGKVWNTRFVGKSAGSVDKKGYLGIAVDKKIYKAHRLAFLWMTGQWPKHEVDHINGVKTDNRWANLRDVSHQMNCENMRVARPNNRSSGVLGVHFSKKAQRFCSSIRVDGKQKWLGYFDSAEQAGDAYLTAKRMYHVGATL